MSFRVGNDIIIDESNVTTTDIISEIIDITNIYGISVQAVATGTIAGSVVIEVSNNKTNWITLASPTITVTNSTNAGAQVADLFYKWLRVRHDATSGTTNTLKVFITTKGI